MQKLNVFQRLDKRRRAIFILYLSGFTQRDIGCLFHMSQKNVTYLLRKCYAEYEDDDSIATWVKHSKVPRGRQKI